jgi:hypothetical protein
MPLPDTVVLRFVSAISDVEDHLVSLAEGHKRDFLGTLSKRYGPEEAARGWLDEEPYLRFLITTYAGQFYGTMTRAIKAMKSRPKKAKRRGKKTVGFAFAAGRGHFLVKAFDPRKPLDPQAEQRISVERQRLDQRFLRALDLYRQQAVGCERYIWRSQDDDRVRARHAGYDDQEFPYSRPPEDGHPGQAYGCRCTAEPVWPEELSKSKIPTPSEQAINNATFSTFFAFSGVFLLIRGLVLVGSVGLTALRSGYQALARSFMRSVAQKELSESGKQALQKEIQKVEQQTRNQNPLFPRPKGIPKDWEYKRTGGDDGDMYIKPGSNGKTYVRFMQAKPESKYKSQQVDYVRLERNGRAIDKNGNSVKRNSEEAHPPMEGFEFEEELYND